MSEASSQIHPLASFADFSASPSAPRWVIPGFIGHGVVVISGAQGIGKTTALLPLALVAAGLLGGELMPIEWRHVIYITEDIEQARRILAGVVGFGTLGITVGAVQERLHLVEAVRLKPSEVAQVGKTYREQFSRTVSNVDVLPLVVLDTKSAVLEQENENDNSEASKMMVALKQGFDGLPIWLIGHVAKPNFGRTEKNTLSSRGASALEADANQTLFLVQEGARRYLVQGKVRFEPRWSALAFTPYTAEVSAQDEYGNAEPVTLRWSIATPCTESRSMAAIEAERTAKIEEAMRLREDIRKSLETAWLSGNPLNRQGIKKAMGRKHEVVLAALDEMISEGWIHEISIPKNERPHPRKTTFLINLSDGEHEAFLRGEGLPLAKQIIPDRWKKATRPPSVVTFQRYVEAIGIRLAA